MAEQGNGARAGHRGHRGLGGATSWCKPASRGDTSWRTPVDRRAARKRAVSHADAAISRLQRLVNELQFELRLHVARRARRNSAGVWL